MENLYNSIAHINGIVNGFVWGAPMLALLIFTGIFYTIRSKGFQFTKVKDIYSHTIKNIFKARKKDDKEKNVISAFQSLTTALSSTIGTGNIAGVSTAIFTGGPGAVFWMWLCALFGMMTHFAEITLGMYFRKKTDNGYDGGTMYSLDNGVGGHLGHKHLGKILAVAFAIFAFFASFGIGNMTQVNSVSEALNTNFGVPPLISGLVLALLAALIIIGGISRIGNFTEKIVPFMSLFYIIIGIIMVIANIKHVPHVFYLIFHNAFSMKAVAGGALGMVMKRAISYGFKRGAFSNEAGLGTSVFAHTASNTKEPVEQGMWGVFEVFFDTLVICTFTSIIILSSSIKADNINVGLSNLTTSEQIVVMNDDKLDDGSSYLVNDEVYKMPIKVDSSNNAVLYKEEPTDGKTYLPVNAYGKTYYVQALSENEAGENDYYFGNAMKVYINPLKHTNGQVLTDENGNPQVDSLHIERVSGVSLVTLAVSTRISHIAGKIVAIAIVLFAFSTCIGWSYYGTKSAEYLGGKVFGYIHKCLFIVFIVVGATMNLSLAWDISDTFNGLMAIPNLIGVLLLSGTCIKILQNYYDRKSGKDVKPMVSYFEEQNKV